MTETNPELTQAQVERILEGLSIEEFGTNWRVKSLTMPKNFAEQFLYKIKNSVQHLEMCKRLPTFNKNHTSIQGGKRWNSCDNNCHFDECEHGDCKCQCHPLMEIKKRVQNLLKQYDHDYLDVFKISDEKVKEAVTKMGVGGRMEHHFAILKVAYSRKELQDILGDVI